MRIVSCVLFCSLLQVACDWVDSTGRQRNSSPEADILLDDAVVGGTPPVLMEEATARITASGSDVDGFVASWGWSEEPIAEGNLDACQGAPDFPTALAVDSLLSACADGALCVMTFDEQAGSEQGSTEFILSTPRLRAPIGVTYALTATDNDGASTSNEYTFCLLAINEAPEAVDDTFPLIEGNQLVVTTERVNLLTNDTDDDDLTNQPLVVNPVAVREPAAASVFELRSDGGFTYAFAGDNLTEDATDSFEYEISDGLHTATATATLRIVASDDAPELVSSIPDLQAIAGIAFEESIADYFIDPEGGALIFNISAGDLPPSNEITLDRFGTLSGTATATDVGEYLLVVEADDGAGTAEGGVTLTVLANEPVAVALIPEQEGLVAKLLSISVGSFFTDPEEQPLTFALDSDDDDVDLTINSRTGAVAGFVDAPGSYTVEVSADDGFNPPTVAEVELVIELDPANNQAPVFIEGTVFNQAVELGDQITRVEPEFDDLEGDELSYRIVGNSLPLGVSIDSDTGVVSGRPRRAAWTRGLRVEATDTEGNTALSDPFWIRVN